MTTIEVQGLTKRYGPDTVVDDLSFTVEPGQVTGFLGPNGAGKSTTMKMILGLAVPTEGTVTIGGRRYRDLPVPLTEVGALLDASAVHGSRTAYDHLLALAVSNGLPRRRVDEVLARAGMEGAARKRAGSFSLGMRQRLGIARCLIADPALLILDEPMNGLDPAGILEMRHLIRAFVDEGRTVFLSSHLLDEVEKTCDQVAIVDQGRVILQGPVAEVASSGDPTVLIAVDDAEAARRVLAGESRITKIDVEAGELRVTLAEGLDPAEVNRALVTAGVAVSRLEPARATLEEKFLAVTSRLETNE
jgi:ABC-2 type transport system ATP-binding protein